ncbi:transcription termination/antitermination protein NusG [Azospirillum agricola]|uniref:transcription termination/antitermination protein NusG n=1 Tax=Azospirillum agricola TaxID=1720247 RepID=UPI000A0F006E|nr:transcription termination/antitermination NusG family protein [Azospirillum agricola]SMH60484.1 transcriptional antiterminator RfaH [Azospirillum lipoferum]
MSDLFSDCEWFAVVSKPGHQQQAKECLERRGFRVFLPMVLEERTRRGVKEAAHRPLFGRYVFVGVHLEQPFHPIASTPGVAFILRGVGGIPSRVTALALRLVKSRCDADGGAVNLIPGARVAQWKPNQPLKVLEGPFRDFIGQFAGGSGETARVFLDVLGRSTVVSIGAQHLEPAVPASTVDELERLAC